MSKHPFSLTIPTDATANLHDHAAVALKIPVTDNGSGPLTLHMITENATKLAREYPGASWARSITPARLVIKPGQTRWFTLHVRVPPGVHGTHYLNFVAQAAAAGSKATARLSGGVGGTLKMIEPGYVKPLPLHSPPPIVLPPAGGGFPWLVLLAGLLLVALVAGGLVLRHRHNAAAVA